MVAGAVMAAGPVAEMAAALVVETAAGLGAGMAAAGLGAWEAVGMARLQSMPYEHVMSLLPGRAQVKNDTEQTYPWTGMRQHGQSVLQLLLTSSAGIGLCIISSWSMPAA